MTLRLDASCRCGAVRFSFDSPAPHPYQRCYCRICRKSAGGGGYAINIMGYSKGMDVSGEEAIALWRAPLERDGSCELSSGERRFCKGCGSALWVSDPDWPDLVHPFASIIDSDLPVPPQTVHMMLKYKANWVVPQTGPDDLCFDIYSDQSIEDWHKDRGLWAG